MDARSANANEILAAIHLVAGELDRAPATALVALVAEHQQYRPFSIDQIARTLELYGVRDAAQFVQPILDSIHRNIHFREVGRSITCVDRGGAQRALGEWLTIDTVWNKITGTRAAIAAEQARVAADAQRRVAAKLAAKAAKQRALDDARAIKKAAKAMPAPQAIPEPPASPSRAIEWSALDPSALDALLARAPSALAHGALVLDAHRFALAGQFEELLCPATMRAVDAHGYQHEAVLRVLRRMKGRAILADEVGLGKTIESIMVLREYQLRAMVRRAMVLVPPALVAQWVDELRARAAIDAHTAESMPDSDEARAQWMAQDGVFVLSTGWARTAKNAPLVRGAAWDLVMVDEAHHLKNRGTLAWQLVNTLRSRFLLLLTATPIESDLEELYNLVTLLRPGQFATPTAFRAQFVDTSNPTSPRNREQLKRLLADVMIRNTRAQSGLKLPPRLVTTQLVTMSAPERELYDAIVAALRAYAEDSSAKAITTTLLLEAGSSPHAIRGTLEKMRSSAKHSKPLRAALEGLWTRASNVVGSRKLDALVALTPETSGQTLVFTRFRATMDAIVEALAKAGRKVAALHGGLDAQGRVAAMQRFRTGEAQVLVATQVGSEGQNLQFCHRLVNFDLPWNPMVIEQRIGRLHRMGQKSEVEVINLCAKGSIEERVLDVLDRRVNLFQLVVGEMDMVLGNLADERDLEERVLALLAESKDDTSLERGLDTIAGELLAARGRYEEARALDESLFGKDFAT
jgi:superfamily II DNA or RNA helicase